MTSYKLIQDYMPSLGRGMLWSQDTEDGGGERCLLARYRLVPEVAAMVTSEKPQPIFQCEVPVKSPTLGEARMEIAESPCV